MRKGAFKPTICSSTNENYLSLLQIFESTDDVSYYFVCKTDLRTMEIKDMYLRECVGFEKWRKAELKTEKQTMGVDKG